MWTLDEDNLNREVYPEISNMERDILYIKAARQEPFLSGDIPKIRGRFVIPEV